MSKICNLHTNFKTRFQKNIMNSIIVFGLILFIPLKSFSLENIEFRNKVYMKNLHSARILLDSWETSYPILEQNSDLDLVFSFDDLDAGFKDFEYTIIHCNSDWTASNLQFFEYADGFEFNDITDISSSRNTFVVYTHYSLPIPNYDVQLKYSGNYLLLIYHNDDGERIPAITWRFMISENLLPIEAEIRQPTGSLYNTGHSIAIKINRKNYNLFDPVQELDIIVMQNNQGYNYISNIEPSFLNQFELVYDNEDKQSFTASNEYRYFNIRNVKYLSEKIRNIEFRKPYYHIQLQPENMAFFEKYYDREDINGHYIVKSELQTVIDENTDVDYTIVHFQCNSTRLSDDNKVYVFGALSGWEIDDAFEMKYNNEKRAYETSLILKQGYYNYRFVVKNQKEIDQVLMEGSHWATENDYQIFVYHKDIRAGYDRLIGYKKLNSRK